VLQLHEHENLVRVRQFENRCCSHASPKYFALDDIRQVSELGLEGELTFFNVFGDKDVESLMAVVDLTEIDGLALKHLHYLFVLEQVVNLIASENLLHGKGNVGQELLHGQRVDNVTDCAGSPDELFNDGLVIRLWNQLRG